MSEFKLLLKRIREKKNFSQKKLAELADLGPVQVCLYEKGKVVPRRKIQRKLEGALGLPIGFFITHMDEHTISNEVVQNILNQLRDINLSPPERSTLYNIAQMILKSHKPTEEIFFE